MPRRTLLAIALLAAILHGVGIARSPLPAQDGLKFLRVAREFHSEPWLQVIRDCDQHPLYPAAVASFQPIVRLFAGNSAETWRLTAQLVSAMASILTLIPIFLLARMLFDQSIGVMAALLFAVLPIPAEVGHDTLSDPLALLAFTWAMFLGVATLRSGRWAPALGCGLAAGLGYLTRPEIAIAPLALVATAALCWVGSRLPSLDWTRYRGAVDQHVDETSDRRSRQRQTHAGCADFPFSREKGFLVPTLQIRAMAMLSFTFLAIVGSYALAKGEVSEKLALRRSVGVSSVHDAATHGKRLLPPGLDDPRWDFSAKEESNAAGRMALSAAITGLLARWSEGVGLAPVPLVILGVWLARRRAGFGALAIFAALFSTILIRHAMTFGYLSSRHVLTLVIISLPLASAGIMACVRAVRKWRGEISPLRTMGLRFVAVAALLALALGVQFHRPPHQSRWGHGEAGKWLAEHATGSERTLDTRGWAAFVSGRSAHDYWHVRQALLDPDLAYIVIGEDELTARSPRGETIRAVLAYAAEPVASFPERRGGEGVGVRIYRFYPPADWRGIVQ